MPNSYTSLHCHVIFGTKQRARLITDEVRPRLYDYMGGIIRGERGTLIAAGGTPDHVHLLMTLHRLTSVSDLMRLVKATSWKWVHETCPECAAFG